MRPQNSASQPFSPLLTAFKTQIATMVREFGIDNIIVATPSWKEFHQVDQSLPKDVFVTQRPLKSGRMAVKPIPSHGDHKAMVDARWPKDGLLSIIEPNLCFILMGPVALPVGDYQIHCLPGQAVLMPPGTPFSDGSLLTLDESRLNNGCCRKLSLRPWAGGVECWLSFDSNNKHYGNSHNPGEHCYVQHAGAYQYLTTLAKELVSRPPEHRLHCNGLLSALIAILIREIQLKHAFDLTQSEGMFFNSALLTQLQEQNPIKRAQTYIDSHLHEKLSIEILAKQAYMSRAYFTKQFRLITGKSVTEYVMKSRLKKAKVLLLNTKLPINAISSIVGISTDRLRVIFLQYEKQTPSDFRCNHQNHH